MHGRQSKLAYRLWLEAVRSRWSLRLAASESTWWLAWRMLRWLWLFSRQTQWLRTVDDSVTMRRVARADPRLYERWHRPYISRHFDSDARRRIVVAHYEFVQRRLPARIRDRILRGHDVRLATLRMEGAAPASLHWRKPARAEAGELALLLLDGDRAVLACCVLTFADEARLLVGSQPGTGAQAGDAAAVHAFLQGSRGLHPQALLKSLVHGLAAFYGLECVHVPPLRAEPGGNTGRATTRVERQAGVPSSHEDAFLREACAVFLDAFRDPLRSRTQTAMNAAARRPPTSDEGLLAASL